MGRDRVLVDGDYVRDGKGGWLTTFTAATKCYHQERTALNTWPGDPGAGRDFTRLKRKDSDEEAARLADSTRRALQRLVDKGVIADVEIEVGGDQLGRLTVQWTATDVQSGQQITGAEFVPYGA